jgi:peptidoglycan/xylan/chitin deacetylase (PgdA/CDA1 family)
VAPPTQTPRRLAAVGFSGGPVGVVHGSRRGRLIALTFDDGPGPYTLALVHELERAHVRATFFMVGFEVHWYPHVVREMIRDGDVIGDHTWSHPALATLPPGQIRSQLLRTAAVIQRYGGVRPTLMRPPYGSFDPSVLRLINRLGFITVLWSVETRDWARPGVPAIVHAALAGARPGAIILMHDAGGNRAQTLAALPTIIRGLRQRGYRLVTVPELLSDAPPPPSGLNHGQSLAGD